MTEQPTPAGGLIDVLPAAAALLGVPGAVDRFRLGDRVGPVDRVVVLLIDGLGETLLPALAPNAPLLADVVTGRAGSHLELVSPFPSTTPVSLVALGTGEPPGENGILGFTVAIPGTIRVLTHIAWRDDPPPRLWSPSVTWFQRAAVVGIDARVVLPESFAGSGLTDAAYRGARFVAADDHYAERLAAEIATGPGLIYGYTAELDTAAHRFGVGSPAWLAAGANVDALVARVANQLPPRTALLVTADHGGLNAGTRYDIGADRRLAEGLRVVAGEPRVRYLHTLPGAAEDVIAAWTEVLGIDAVVCSRDDAIARGWFGPVRAQFASRIGDVVVACQGDAVVFASDREPAAVSELIGVHGASTRAETAIPLIALT